MPHASQRTISLPRWIIEEAENYFKQHEEELKAKDITTVTALIRYWVIQNAKSQPHSTPSE
jgi:hypothetical protein